VNVDLAKSTLRVKKINLHPQPELLHSKTSTRNLKNEARLKKKRVHSNRSQHLTCRKPGDTNSTEKALAIRRSETLHSNP